MRNDSFSNLNYEEREHRFLDVIYKKTYGNIDKRSLLSIIKRLDLTKQIAVNVVSKSQFNLDSKMKDCIHIEEGEISRIDKTWVSILAGDISLGVENKVVTDSMDCITNNTATTVKQYPAIVHVIKETMSDKQDSISNSIVICLSGF